MEKLTTAQRTAQVNAWKHRQCDDTKDDIIAYRQSQYNEETARRRSYYEARMAEEVSRRKVYTIEHADHIKAQQKQYKIDNGATIKAQRKEHYEDNKDAILSKNRRYARDHPRDPRGYVLDPCKCTNLNDWFEGCRRHHVDATTIIHIPYAMHVTTYHNSRTGEGMAQINAMAFEFLSNK